jgi:hypothetical protein
LEWTPTQSYLGNTHTLSLATTDSSYEVIPNLGVDGMRDAKHGHDDVPHVLRMLFPGDAREPVTRGPCLSSKPERLAHRELGEVDVLLRLVDGLPSKVMTLDFLRNT